MKGMIDWMFVIGKIIKKVKHLEEGKEMLDSSNTILYSWIVRKVKSFQQT